MTGNEIFDHVIYGHTVFRRDHDAWDLIDADGLVAAVLCPRTNHLTVSLPSKRVPPKPVGRRIPYGEKKVDEIRGEATDLQRGRDLLAQLARSGR